MTDLLKSNESIAFLALIVSSIALAVSLFTFWWQHLRSSRIQTVAGALTMRIYPIINGNDSWYMTTLYTPISITNEGAKTGQVKNFRIMTKYPQISDEAFEIFRWHSVVDGQTYDNDNESLFKWQGSSIVARDDPFFILPKETLAKNIVFMARWDHPISSDEIKFTLQVRSGNKWTDSSEWSMPLGPMEWSEMTNNKTSFSVHSTDSYKPGESYHQKQPSNLHELIRYKGKLPDNGFGASPSYELKKDRRNQKKKS